MTGPCGHKEQAQSGFLTAAHTAPRFHGGCSKMKAKATPHSFYDCKQHLEAGGMNPQLHMSSSLPPFSSQEHAKQHPWLPPNLPAATESKIQDPLLWKEAILMCYVANTRGLDRCMPDLILFKRNCPRGYQSTAECTSQLLLRYCKSQHGCATWIRKLQPPCDSSHCPSQWWGQDLHSSEPEVLKWCSTPEFLPDLQASPGSSSSQTPWAGMASHLRDICWGAGEDITALSFSWMCEHFLKHHIL